MRDRLRFVILAAFIATTMLPAAAQQRPDPFARLRPIWTAPPAAARPMMRWWWFGPAVEPADLAAELQRMRDAGIGGVEVQPVYPVTLDAPGAGPVNAPFLAKERGLDVREVRHDREGVYHTLVRVTVGTAQGDRSVAGTLFGNTQPRLVELFGIAIEADLDGHMLYIVNEDAPGFIGRIGSLLGENGLNIGTFHLGRREAGGEAILLLAQFSQLRCTTFEFLDEFIQSLLQFAAPALLGCQSLLGLDVLAV